MDNEGRRPKTESALNLLIAIGGAASILAGLLKWIFDIYIRPEIIVGIVFAFFVLQWFYARGRFSRNAPPPFPKFLWQLIFNEIGATSVKELAPARIAVLHAPDGREFSSKLGETHHWSCLEVKLAQLGKDENSEAYAASHLLVDVTNANASDRLIFRHLLRNIQGILLVWTDGWLKYEWSLEEVSRWARRFPQNPVVVVQKEEGELPGVLKWVTRDKVGNQERYLKNQSSAWLLLRQALMRHNSLRQHSSLLRSVVLASWLFIALLSIGLYHYSKKTTELLAVSGNAVSDFAQASHSMRSAWEFLIEKVDGYSDGVKTSGTTMPSAKQDVNKKLLPYFASSIRDIEEALEGQIHTNFGLKVEAAIFARVQPKEGPGCWCEAFYEPSDHDCFVFDKSVISCAGKKNWIVWWKTTADNPEGTFQAWNLRGEAIPSSNLSDCRWVADKPIDAENFSEKNADDQKYEEILCWPAGSEISQGRSSGAGVCISLEKVARNKLDNSSLRSRILLSSSTVADIPWGWFAATAPHMNCDSARR